MQGGFVGTVHKGDWRHDFESEPVMLYSELDEKRNELRKVKSIATAIMIFPMVLGQQGIPGSVKNHPAYLGYQSGWTV
ncbi:DUF6881 domain-containing protein [Herbaspirillum rhizosphaerae]|uniref:DUF6881 domain-containing protein n=1 Tax=Herbaspirillum rhizosphaerae TaxID=346179 RepID=UPI0038BD844E